MIDPAVSMAVAVHSHKGIYSLLLGSGVSRAAGIPTGWEVLVDLIRRVSVASGEDAKDKPEAWFRGKYGVEPSYSEILRMLAPTPAERTALLRAYFEPTEEERQQSLKLPTAAHKAIARLVARGHIRVIVTTNFDRLLERAIEAEGVSPTIVSTEDQVEGMMPLPHVQCLVVKVHGDYLDTRLRNIPDELSQYSPALNGLLDRVLSEYGLIICGWSGEWDVALVEAIVRNTRFRFSTFWLARSSKLSEAASDLVKRRNAVVVSIEGADKAFAELEAKVAALEDQRLADPASPRIAVALTKRLLSNGLEIDLHDLVMSELSQVLNKISISVMPLGTPTPDENSYPSRVARIEAACSVLAPMIATITMWDQGRFDDLSRRVVQALSMREMAVGLISDPWARLRYLAATIIAYSAGVGALIRGRLSIFHEVFLKAKCSDGVRDPRPAIDRIVTGRCFSHEIAQSLHGKDAKRRTPGADWMFIHLRQMLEHVIPPDRSFEDLYHELEFIVSLISADETNRAAPGRFMWFMTMHHDECEHVRKAKEDLKSLESNHPFIEAGLFRGEVVRLASAIAEVEKAIREVGF